MAAYTEDQLSAEKSRHEHWLHAQPGVTGSGIGMGRGGEPCILILTNGIDPATRTAISHRLQGLPVEFDETGEIRAL